MTENFYQNWKVFHKLYPFDKCDKISSGIQGDIYKSGNFVIKHFFDFEDFINEVFFGIIINHPNILKLISWSTINENCYICYPFGLNVEKMYLENKISLDDIISDTLSAVLYLLTMKIYHGDIWIKNLIYHDGKVKLIDFGISGFNFDKSLMDLRACVYLYRKLTIDDCEKLDLLDDHIDDLHTFILENLDLLNVKIETISTKRCRDFEFFEISKNNYNLNSTQIEEVNKLFSRFINMNIKKDKSLEDSCIWLCCKSTRYLIKINKAKILFILKTLH